MQFAASNGTGALTWKLDQVPPGLTLSADGLLSGTPTGNGCPDPLNVSVTDSATPANTATRSLQFSAEGITDETRVGQVGVYYGAGFGVDCAVEPIQWSIVNGSLPPGLSPQPFPGVDGQLDLNGDPTQPGNFSFTVQATDGAGHVLPLAASVHVLPVQLMVVDNLMQLGVVNQPFQHTITATGGTVPYTFTLTSGALPAGLQLNSATGVISGTPTAAGFSQFTVSIADSTAPNAFTSNKPDSILVTPAALASRNDTIATATPIVPGSYTASLSPYTDASGAAAPDQDFYALQGSSGDTFLVSVGGNVSLWNPGFNVSTPSTESTIPRSRSWTQPAIASPPAMTPSSMCPRPAPPTLRVAITSQTPASAMVATR